MKPPQGAELSKMPQHTIEVGIGRKPKLFFQMPNSASVLFTAASSSIRP